MKNRFSRYQIGFYLKLMIRYDTYGIGLMKNNLGFSLAFLRFKDEDELFFSGCAYSTFQ